MLDQVRLSESAVAVLRFLIKGFRVPITERRLPAFRELADARIIEPVPGPVTEFRFTEDGFRRRDEILREEEGRIEGERYAPPDGNISEAAKETLRRHLEGDRKVTETNLAAYRELAAAQIMVPLHGFVGGWESAFRLTYWGMKRGWELAGVHDATETAG